MGHLVETVDNEGRRTVYHRDHHGRILRQVHSAPTGSWEEHFLRSERGPVLHGIKTSLGRFQRIARELGLNPRGIAPQAADRSQEGGRRISSNYASITKELEADGRIHTNEILGKAMTIRTRIDGEEVLREDDWGGGRSEVWTSDGELISVRDDSGPIVITHRDAEGRLSEVEIGESMILRYIFKKDSADWIRKDLINSADGKLIGSWNAVYHVNTEIGFPRSRVEAFLPGYGLVAEWDDLLTPDGAAVASTGTLPYALLPLQSDGELFRTVEIRSLVVPFSNDRIDYSDREIRLHLTLGMPMPDSSPAGALVIRSRTTTEDLP